MLLVIANIIANNRVPQEEMYKDIHMVHGDYTVSYF
jgi:hypothetical protein